DPVRAAPGEVERVVVVDVGPEHPGREPADAEEERPAVEDDERVVGEEPPAPCPEAVGRGDALLEVRAPEDGPAEQREDDPEEIPGESEPAVVRRGIRDASRLPRIRPDPEREVMRPREEEHHAHRVADVRDRVEPDPEHEPDRPRLALADEV